MSGPDARPSQSLPKSPEEELTLAEQLISTIGQALGNSYSPEMGVVTGSYPKGALVFRTVGFRRKGIMGSNSERLGARTLLTLVTDAAHVRAVSADEKKRELLKAPPRQIEGWMPQDGRSLVEQTVWPEEDIPAGVRIELDRAGVPYFATGKIFEYAYLGLSAKDYLAHELEQASQS